MGYSSNSSKSAGEIVSRKQRKLEPEKLRKYIKSHPDAYQREIAEAFKCTKSAVSLALIKHGITRGKKQKIPGELDSARLRKYIKSHPDAYLREIAEVFDCSGETVSRALRYLGIIRSKKPEKLDPEELKRYVENNPEAYLREVAETFGCSIMTVSKVLRRHGIARNETVHKINPEELKRYINDNPYAYIREIAEVFGCSVETVWKTLRRNGIARIKKTVNYRKINIKKLRKYVKWHPDAYLREIAEIFDCSEMTVSVALRRHRIPRTGRPRTRKIDPEKLRKYVEAHPDAYLREIAKVFGCSEMTASTELRQHGITRIKRPIVQDKIKLEKLKKYLKTHPNASRRDIMKEFDCSYGTVSVTFRRHGITCMKSKVAQGKLRPEKLKKYLEAKPNASRKDIAKKFRCSERTVSRAFRRDGIKI